MGNTQNTPRNEDLGQEPNFPTDFSEYDENIINRGTLGRPKPLLKFHTVCGTNIQILNDGRVARRKESFCKGLAFSNRPISIDEIICIRLCEVGTNWSGVMRFGVTNVDPASFRDIELPKFACPDLTSKGGYWAKSLAERYSIENAILHFFVNENGEMYYGVNGVHKGLFLSGINVLSPLWIIVDIYGNSIGVEFIDPAIVQHQQKTAKAKQQFNLDSSNVVQIGASSSNTSSPISAVRSHHQQQHQAGMTASCSANNLLSAATISSRSPSTRASPSTNSKLRFHNVKGNNVSLLCDDTVAVRLHGEYYLGYVFTERPIRIGEKLVILVRMTEDAFSGSLAFGLTSCDPTQVPASRLPADSDELLERPEYWVCIKDVGAMPQVGDKLSFQVDAAGRVLFSKNDASSRVIMHVDVSIPLWAFFDLYGSTRKIQILDQDQVNNTSLGISDLARSFRASSEGATCGPSSTVDRLTAASQQTQPRLNRPISTQWNMDSLRVVLPAEMTPSSTSSIASATIPADPIVALPTTPTATGAAASSTSSSATGVSTSAPTTSSSTALSLGISPFELAKIRADITLRRLNQQQQAMNLELSSAATNNNSNTPSSTTTTPVNPLLIANENVAIAHERIMSQLMARRRLREAQSPNRLQTTTTTGTPTGRSTYADLFETTNIRPNSGTSSITVPLLPPPLFSSLDISTALEARGEQQNRRNQAVEFESTNRSSSDNSPIRGGAADDMQQNNGGNVDDDRNNECSICMNNRVNAVIYRCGHMCMCFPCAKETHRRSGDCPICRCPIIDVIRCYPV